MIGKADGLLAGGRLVPLIGARFSAGMIFGWPIPCGFGLCKGGAVFASLMFLLLVGIPFEPLPLCQ